MRIVAPLFILASYVMLQGCLAQTALDVVTAPVKIVSKGADLATTSQSEADEKRGRALRKREEELGKLDRERSKLSEKCADGSDSACRDLAEVEAQIRALMPTIPVGPG